MSASLPPSVEQITPFDYRDPSQLPDGGVLVVGASATGVQLADEIRRSGRPVTLAVGEHVRLPRRYRGRDVLWWMDRSGVWDERYDEIDDLTRARRLPSPQLVGAPDTTLDLNALTRDRGRAGGPGLGGPRRLGALLRWAPEHVRAGGPEAQPPAGDLRRVGARSAGDVRRRGRRRRAGTLRADACARIVAGADRSAAAARSGRSSGRPASVRTTAGCTCPSWTRRDTCATTAASSTARGWSCSGCPCCAGASRASSTVPRTMRASWWITSRDISGVGSSSSGVFIAIPGITMGRALPAALPGRACRTVREILGRSLLSLLDQRPTTKTSGGGGAAPMAIEGRLRRFRAWPATMEP